MAASAEGLADGSQVCFIRLGGNAVLGGEQTIMVGGESYIDVQAGSDAAHGSMLPLIIEDVDLDITPNETLDISIEMMGVDVGTATAVVTAVFK